MHLHSHRSLHPPKTLVAWKPMVAIKMCAKQFEWGHGESVHGPNPASQHNEGNIQDEQWQILLLNIQLSKLCCKLLPTSKSISGTKVGEKELSQWCNLQIIQGKNSNENLWHFFRCPQPGRMCRASWEVEDWVISRTRETHCQSSSQVKVRNFEWSSD